MDVTVLLVEDDDVVRTLLSAVLRSAGYSVTSEADGSAALQLLTTRCFDVVVTDIQLGTVNGIEVVEAARRSSSLTEVIVLTSSGSVETVVAAMRAGAFDYLLKPCQPAELLQGVATAAQRAYVRRRQAAAVQVLAAELLGSAPADSYNANNGRLALPQVVTPPTDKQRRLLTVGSLVLDLYSHAATFAGKPLHLTPTEFALLCCLANTPGRVVSVGEIARQTHANCTTDYEMHMLLRSHIRNLRRKLPDTYLVTVRGTGYMLVDPNEVDTGSRAALSHEDVPSRTRVDVVR